jgi:hypothetical protein
MKEKIQMPNEDSFFNMFKSGVQKLPILLAIEDKNDNKTNEYFEINKYHKFEEIDTTLIKEMASIKGYSKILIPVITMNYYNAGFAPGTRGDYIKYLTISVFIIENNSIVYSKSLWHVQDVYSASHPYKYRDYHIPIPQEHWDGIIKDLMKEYIERLK